MILFARVLSGITMAILSGIVMANWSIPLAEWMFSSEVNASLSIAMGYGLVLANLMAMIWAGIIAFVVWSAILFGIQIVSNT